MNRKELLEELKELEKEGLVKGCQYCGHWLHIEFYNEHMQKCKELQKLK